MAEFDMAAFIAGQNPLLEEGAAADHDESMARSTSSISSVTRVFNNQDIKNDPDIDFLSKGTRRTLFNALSGAEHRAAGGQLLWEHYYSVLDAKVEEMVDAEGSLYDPSVVPRDMPVDASCTVKECMQHAARVLIALAKARHLEGAGGDMGGADGADGGHDDDAPAVLVSRNIFGEAAPAPDVDMEASTVIHREDAQRPITRRQVMLEDGSLHMEPHRVVVLPTLTFALHHLGLREQPVSAVLGDDEADCEAGEEVFFDYRWSGVPPVPPTWRLALLVLLVSVLLVAAIVFALSQLMENPLRERGEVHAVATSGTALSFMQVVRDAADKELGKLAATVAKDAAALVDTAVWEVATELQDSADRFDAEALHLLTFRQASARVALSLQLLLDSVRFLADGVRLDGEIGFAASRLLSHSREAATGRFPRQGWTVRRLSDTVAEVRLSSADWRSSISGSRFGAAIEACALSDQDVLAAGAFQADSDDAVMPGLSNRLLLNSVCMTNFSSCFVASLAREPSPSDYAALRCTDGSDRVQACESRGFSPACSFVVHASPLGALGTGEWWRYCEEPLFSIVDDVFLDSVNRTISAADSAEAAGAEHLGSESVCVLTPIVTNSSGALVSFGKEMDASVAGLVQRWIAGPTERHRGTTRRYAFTSAAVNVVAAFQNVGLAELLSEMDPKAASKLLGVGLNACSVAFPALRRAGFVRVCDVSKERDAYVRQLVSQWSAPQEAEQQQQRLVAVASVVVGQLDERNTTIQISRLGTTSRVPVTRYPHLFHAAHGRSGAMASTSVAGGAAVAGFAYAAYARRAIAVEIPEAVVTSQLLRTACGWMERLRQSTEGPVTRGVLLSVNSSGHQVALCAVAGDSAGLTEEVPSAPLSWASVLGEAARVVHQHSGVTFAFFSHLDSSVHAVRAQFVEWLGASAAVATDVEPTVEALRGARGTIAWVAVALVGGTLGALALVSKLTLRDIARRYRAYKRQVDAEKQSFVELLRDAVPPHLFRRVEAGERLFLDHTEHLSFALADICNVSDIWRSSADPFSVVHMLGYLFMLEDGLASYYGLHKLRTIGDAYLCVGGFPESPVPRGVRWADLDDTHVFRIVSYATVLHQLLSGVYEHHPEKTYSMRSFAEEHRLPVARDALALPLLRVGIHFGAAFVGVVDVAEAPSFDCYGPVMVHLAGVESTAAPGTVQVSSAARAALRDQDPDRVFEFGPSTRKLLRDVGTVPVYVVSSARLRVPEELLDWLGVSTSVRHRLHTTEGLRCVSTHKAVAASAAALRNSQGDAAAFVVNDEAASLGSAAPPSVRSDCESSEGRSESESGGIKPFHRRHV